jgi:hypothetical protein
MRRAEKKPGMESGDGELWCEGKSDFQEAASCKEALQEGIFGGRRRIPLLSTISCRVSGLLGSQGDGSEEAGAREEG